MFDKFLPHIVMETFVVPQDLDPFLGQAVVFDGLAPLVCRGFPNPSLYEPSFAQLLQRDIDLPERPGLAGMFLKMLPDIHQVGILPDTQDCQEKKLFLFGQKLHFKHSP
jgi:hypothetical protein